MDTQFNYGNWIRKRNLLILGFCTLGIGALLFIPLGFPYQVIVMVLFAIALVSFLFPLYAYMIFSQRGGRFQEKVYNLIIQSLGSEVKGRFLDIGSGNGMLTVQLAQQHPEVQVVGIDYWGKDWEYSKGVCEKNARAARVESRVRFQKGDAAALEFANETFEGAISNLTFHEVRSVMDKRAVVQEALRVIKPGGTFAFVDYFYDEKYYGKIAEFESYLRNLGLSQFRYKPLQYALALPMLLRHPRIFGKVGIIYGRK
jgi:ubiquinone/menaquinone biosynthesis C-methylase UbiE